MRVGNETEFLESLESLGNQRRERACLVLVQETMQIKCVH